MSEVFYDNDGSDDMDAFGTPIVPVFPFAERMDFETLILGMESDHAKVVLIRHFGLQGKKAARAGGFSSEWSFYRRAHDLKKILARQREHFVG